MVYVIVLGWFCIAVIICGICMRDLFGKILIGFGVFLFVFLIFLACTERSSPIESATDEIVSSESIKLATILENEDSDCYVLRDSQGNYYFITEVENQFGVGKSLFEEKWISGCDVIVVEDETSDYPFVEVIELDARVTAESLGIQPVYKYVFHVPNGTIQFTEDMPVKE